MEQFDGQLVLTLTCVLLSASVLIRRFVQFVRHPSGSGCHSGGCSGCPSRAVRPGNTPQELVQLRIENEVNK